MTSQPRRGRRSQQPPQSAAGQPLPQGSTPGQADAPAGGPGPAAHVLAVLAGLRAPIVVILLLIAFFSAISGKPLDGALIGVVGVSLAWDTGRRARSGDAGDRASAQRTSEGSSGDGMIAPGAALAMGMEEADRGALVVTDASDTAALRTRVLVMMGVAAGLLYAAVTGSFSRYSWPPTVAVIIVGLAVIAIGWQGPRRVRTIPDRIPTVGLVAWGVVFVTACLWELTSLLLQPTLTTSSYTHPTISTLSDPLLSASPGRALVLAAWLGLGWFLVER